MRKSLDCRLTPKWWLMLSRRSKLQVYREVPVSYLDKSLLKAIGTRWVYTNKGDAANPFIRARLLAQATKKLTPEGASRKCAATPPLESLMFMLSRCMTGNRRAPAAVKVLGFYDISRAHVHSPARRTIVINVPREDDECKSVPCWTAMHGAKDAAQCFECCK